MQNADRLVSHKAIHRCNGRVRQVQIPTKPNFCDGDIMARPRTFEPEEALQAIQRVFWKKGYEATTLRDIEEATELNKQSLYRLYVDKQGMYLRALVDYGQRELTQTLTMFSRVDGPEAYFAQLFAHIIDEAVLRDNRMGCFLCNAAVDQAQTDSKNRRSCGDNDGIRP